MQVPTKFFPSENGKGSAPRNLSEKFRANYDAIDWTKKPVKRARKSRRKQPPAPILTLGVPFP